MDLLTSDCFFLFYVFQCTAYTMAKYGMSMCVLGMSEEFKDDGIAVNALWPKTGNVLFVCFSFFGTSKVL